MLRLEMLPAERGDSLLLEYGAGDTAEHRVLIDGGKAPAWPCLRERLMQIPVNDVGERHFDLLVITHIDTDHIDGVILLLQDPELRCRFDDIWFNGWKHLAPLEKPKPESLGPKQGEFLGALLAHLDLPWNRHFDGNAVIIPDDGPLPRIHLAGGLTLTLLSPTLKQLLRLKRNWKKVIEDVGFEPGDNGAALIAFGERMLTHNSLVTLGGDDPRHFTATSRDGSVANASSIAFMAEFEGRRLLLAGDAVKPTMVPSLTRWRDEHADLGEDDRIPIDAFKLPHHGSDKNVSPQLLKLLACDRYLVSTNSAGFEHPDAGAVGIIVKTHPEGTVPNFAFNYRSEHTNLFATNDRWTSTYEADSIVEFPSPASDG